MEHICIITSRYPTSVDPTSLTFVQQLAWSMADQGKRISVICPLPTNLNAEFSKIPELGNETTHMGNRVELYFPRFIGFGQRTIGPVNTAGITTAFFTSAVRKVLKKMEALPDVLYGHFVTPAGLCACRLGKEFALPSFIAYGESSTWSIDHIGRKKVKKEIADVNGIISVSSKNSKELVEIGVTEGSKIKVFPNGYIPSRFAPRDKEESRKMLNIPENVFVVAFVGHFIARKGIGVLCRAVDDLGDVYLICAGKGDLKPEGDRVLYAAPVNPEKLSYFYSAADVFVLPTLNEGCCNAIVEAIACGLPIISSNLSFNDDILDESNSLRIDPTSSDQVREAISQIKNSPELRQRLSEGSFEKSKSLTLEQRAHNILRFMEERI